MAEIVSNSGKAKIIKGAIKTIAVYVFATPKIEIIDNEKPKKLEPVSPINVLAGLKLKGKNPSIDPAKAVINIIAIKGESFNVKIINKERQEIAHIPEDSPSSPSIKLMAFVIPTIQIVVKIIDTKSCEIIFSRPGTEILSILMPLKITIKADIVCPSNFTYGGIPFQSSKKQKVERTTIPMKNPINLI